MTTNTYTVKGMTCGHCVQAVTKELTGLSGVERVDVDLDSGRVTVESASAIDPAAVRGAVDEAGFELVGD